MNVIKQFNLRLVFIAIFIFLFAFSIRVWNLNQMGRWSDEPALVEKGYVLTDLLLKQDFNNPFWYKEATDHPPFAMYFYGLASRIDFVRFDPKLASSFYVHTGAPIFNYDLTYSRLVSVLASSLSVLLVFIIGFRYFSFRIGIISSLILSLLPHFLAYSQLITYESFVMLFYTASVLAFLLFLEKRSLRYLLFTGILTGLSLGVKESTIVIFSIYFLTYLSVKLFKFNLQFSFKHLLIIFGVAFITYVLIWPMPWLHFSEYSKRVYDLWFKDSGNVPEVLFGKRTGARFFYYPLAVLITTPVVVLILALLGFKKTLDNSKNWAFLLLIIWLVSPFFMMVFHHRQHMVRYIIEILAPLCILAAIGLESLLKYVNINKYIKDGLLIGVFIYLLAIVYSYSPYYLTYYNELVGGTKNVYEKKQFMMGWFGEGLRNPGIYLANTASNDSRIGIAIDPLSFGAIYTTPKLKYEKFDKGKRYDFVMVNYYNIIRIGFDQSVLDKEYKLVHTEKAHGVGYVWIYKHK